MFQVDQSQNRLRRLEQRHFAELNLREREHLQEWLAHQPDVLGEDLLILQKEFDGFDGTRERLDLLALDKQGRLVVIENKLDDSGRDVTWQALKYTAYVSGMTKAQIIDAFQQYLDRYQNDGDAEQVICAFLGVAELDEVVLNPGHQQRLFFVAANFRREVTATVLWLREHQIDARCFKVTPYSFEEELLLDIQPVIPTPEVADFMIGMAQKESEETRVQGAKTQNGQARHDYWAALLEKLEAQGSKAFAGLSAHNNHWLNGATPISNCTLTLVFVKAEIRVQLFIAREDCAENMFIFDRLHEHREAAEVALGGGLVWKRDELKRETSVTLVLQGNPYDRAEWQKLMAWHLEAARKWEAFFFPLMHDLRPQIRVSSSATGRI